MTKGFSFVVLCSAVLVAGCKSHLTADINVSDLTSHAIKNTTATLYAEVASCSSYEDSRNPSSSLIEAQKIIPSLFANAKFESCFQQKMDSFAQFSIPLMVGSMTKDEDFKPEVIKIFSQVDNELLLGVHMPKAIKANFEMLLLSVWLMTRIKTSPSIYQKVSWMENLILLLAVS